MSEERKRGRPKVQRPKRIKATVTIMPDIYEKAMEKAYANDSTFSRTVEELLKRYINEDN